MLALLKGNVHKYTSFQFFSCYLVAYCNETITASYYIIGLNINKTHILIYKKLKTIFEFFIDFFLKSGEGKNMPRHGNLEF